MYDMHQRALLPVSEKAIFVPLGLGGEIVGPCSFDTAECWDRAAPTSKPHRFVVLQEVEDISNSCDVGGR